MILRKMEKKDIYQFKMWIEMPHIAKWYHDPENWLHEVEEMDGEFKWISHFIAEADGKAIGFCQFYACVNSDEVWEGCDSNVGLYSIDYLIGDTAYLGKGYGKKIVKELLIKISEFSDATRVVVQPEGNNLNSRGLLESCGFIEYGSTGVYLKEL